MEFNEVLNNILYILLSMILPIVATYVVNLVKSKIKESNIIAEITKSENIANLIEEALSNVMDAVLYVSQTYTDSLKASGEFTEEAHKIAFNKAYDKAMFLISDAAKEAITSLYGSFDKWLELQIESTVQKAKKG